MKASATATAVMLELPQAKRVDTATRVKSTRNLVMDNMLRWVLSKQVLGVEKGMRARGVVVCR